MSTFLLGKDKGKKGAEPVQAPPPEPETQTEECEPPEPPPKTYVIKDKYDYFRPNIQVRLHLSTRYDRSPLFSLLEAVSLSWN